MKAHGVRFQPSLGGTLHLSRTNAFFLGGGKALVNAYYHAAAATGRGDRLRDARWSTWRSRAGASTRSTVDCKGARHEVRARAVVVAAGGFESNLDWLREAWGPPGRQLHRARHALQHAARC